MKKLILSLVILVMAASLTAQVSVWDGSYEEFDTSNEKGLTEDNPILIENAAQLAFMSQKPYSANNKKYYKLTTDIDLNYLPWTAIGLLGHSIFYGYFDGGNHSISKLEFTLFSYAQGYIKNLTITDTDFVLEDAADYPFGSVTFGAYYDEVLVIENCHSYANITVKDGFNFAIGGIVGECGQNTYIYNCSNHGDINVTQEDGLYPVVGGIGGLVFNTSFCYNTGDIKVESSFINNVKVGGIAGIASKAVKNCYNTGNVETTVYNDGTSITGGIIGYGGGNGALLSCYNVGNVKGESSSGLVALVENENIFVVDNCFMTDSNENNGYGEAVSDDFMKSDEFVEMLNKYDNYYKKDVEPFVNDGYPVFDSEKIPALDINGTIGVDETIAEVYVEIYPNPASDFVRVSTVNGQQSTVRVYNTLGMLVEEIEMNSEEIEINISDYKSGMYFIDVDGTISKIVVR